MRVRPLWVVELSDNGFGPKRGSFTLKNYRDFTALVLGKSVIGKWLEHNWLVLRDYYQADRRKLGGSVNFMSYMSLFIADDLMAEYRRLVDNDMSLGQSHRLVNKVRQERELMVGGNNNLLETMVINLYIYLVYIFVPKLGQSLCDIYPLSYFDEETLMLNGGGNIRARTLDEKIFDKKPRGIYLLEKMHDNGEVERWVMKISNYDADISWDDIMDGDEQDLRYKLRGSQFVYEGYMYSLFNILSNTDSTVYHNVVRMIDGEEVILEPEDTTVIYEVDGIELEMGTDDLMGALRMRDNSDTPRLFCIFTNYDDSMVSLITYMNSVSDYMSGGKFDNETIDRKRYLIENYSMIMTNLYQEIFRLYVYLSKTYNFVHGDLHGHNLLVRYIPARAIEDRDMIMSGDGEIGVNFFDFDWSLFINRTDSVLIPYMNRLISIDISGLGIENPVHLGDYSHSDLYYLYDVGRLLFHNGNSKLINYLGLNAMREVFKDIPDNWLSLMNNLIEKYNPLSKLIKSDNSNSGLITMCSLMYRMVDFAIQVGYLVPLDISRRHGLKRVRNINNNNLRERKR